MIDTSIHNVVKMETFIKEVGKDDEAFLVQEFKLTDENNNVLIVKAFLKGSVPLELLPQE
tara:strand:+ start:97 stop:276 length:180 start_codon:yes stop_codon:yes gene_type:complete